MRTIEPQGWYRKEHFDLFNRFEFPHLNICAPIDVTELWAHRNRLGASPSIALVYVLSKAANRVPELRQRIRGDQIVEHDIVHPLITLLGENDLFGVVTLEYAPDFKAFAAQASERIAQTSGNTTLDDFPHQKQGQEDARDDLLSITILPWLAFTSFSITRQPRVDCIPLFAIGKVHPSEDRSLMPFYINFHHALVDGLHVARLVKYMEEEAQALASAFA